MTDLILVPLKMNVNKILDQWKSSGDNQSVMTSFNVFQIKIHENMKF